MELKPNCTNALLIPTSMGVRLTPSEGQPFQAGSRYLMTVTSAESNVGSVSSYLGLPVKILTNFVAGSPVSQIIKDNLLSRHMTFEGPDIPRHRPAGSPVRRGP